MVFSVAFFGHGRAFVSGGEDRSARVWEVGADRAKLTLLGHAGAVEMVAVSPDDRVVATASWDRTVRFWDPATGEERATLTGHNGPVFALAFSANGKLLATATDKGTVYLWDVETRQPLRTCQEHGTAVWALAFSPDGKLLASGGSDKAARLWDMAAGREAATLSTVGTDDTPDGLPAVVAKPSLVAAGLVVALVGLSGLGMWGLSRRGRRTAEAPGRPAAPTAPPTLTVRCSGCGKSLHARAELAGKKGKCPGCGRPVQVPQLSRGTSPAAGGITAPPPVKAAWAWGLAALLVLALLGAGVLSLRRPARTTSLLNVTAGNEYVAGVEESGFHAQQFAGNGEPCRWTDGHGKLEIPIDPARPPRALRVRLFPYRPANGREAAVRILVNKHELFRQTLPRLRWEQTFDLGGLDLGDRVVVEVLSDTFVPAEIKDAGPDTRTLGVEVRGVTLLGPADEPKQ
jgi:hypothetical protein